MMITTEGGMVVPSDPPAQTVPAARSLRYPAPSIAGTAMMPTTISTAPTTPDEAAKIPHMTMVVIASPPRSGPNQILIASNSLAAMPARSSIAPMNTKSGIAARMKFDETSNRRL